MILLSCTASVSVRLRQLVASSLVALAACATTPVGHKDLLSFLADGVTRKEEVYKNLGSPSAQFEESRILTYRLGQNKGGFFAASAPRDDWSTYRYSLVLVFDSGGILTRHSLVEVRPK